MTDPDELAGAITDVLGRRGPTDPLVLAQLLDDAGIAVSGRTLGQGLVRAGAVSVMTPTGASVALLHERPGPVAEPATPPPLDDLGVRDTVRAMPARSRRWLLVFVVSVVVLLVAALVAASHGAPTLHDAPPVFGG